MKNILMSLLSISAILGFSQELKFVDAQRLLIEGTSISAAEKGTPYDRLPASYRDKVRPPIWGLSRNTAGIAVRFITNSPNISVKWTLLNDFNMNHMAETGIKGIDLYTKNGEDWQYVNTGRPNGLENEKLFKISRDPGYYEYRVYLPLYDGVTKMEIGIDQNAEIRKPDPYSNKPIVFYGTSITQGGCASRTGMVHTSIISRKLDRDCINLGFSGNGIMELPIGEIMAKTDAEFYVIECLPNMTIEHIENNTVPLANYLKEQRPNTPIVFMKQFLYETSFYDSNISDLITQKNKTIEAQFEKLKASGMKDIYLLDVKEALGTDHEGTVDGVHFTDLGFSRYADFLINELKNVGLVE